MMFLVLLKVPRVPKLYPQMYTKMYIAHPRIVITQTAQYGHIIPLNVHIMCSTRIQYMAAIYFVTINQFKRNCYWKNPRFS